MFIYFYFFRVKIQTLTKSNAMYTFSSVQKFFNVLILIITCFYSSCTFSSSNVDLDQEKSYGHAGFFYAELGSGYADTGYGDFYNRLTGDAIDSDNINGGLTYLGDVGYEFLPHLSLEFGGGQLPEAKGRRQGEAEQTKIQSWFGYIAGRLDIDLSNAIGTYVKIGASYRSLTATRPSSNEREKDYAEPFLGVGFSYGFNRYFYASVEYNYMAGANYLGSVPYNGRTLNIGAPDTNLVQGKLGFKYQT